MESRPKYVRDQFSCKTFGNDGRLLFSMCTISVNACTGNMTRLLGEDNRVKRFKFLAIGKLGTN